jgi:DNA-binding NarL/FixJ family response regulator
MNNSAQSAVVRVVIVAATRLYREGLARALDADERFQVDGALGDLDTAVDLLADSADQPTVLLLDQSIPEGPDAVHLLHEAAPELSVVALAVREAERDVLPWVEAGALGIVGNDLPLDDLCDKLADVADGCGLCSPRIAGLMFNRLAALSLPHEDRSAATCLTVREQEIAALLNEGLSNKEIGDRLGIRVPTVKNHVHSILAKLRVRRRGEAACAVRGASRGHSS